MVIFFNGGFMIDSLKQSVINIVSPMTIVRTVSKTLDKDLTQIRIHGQQGSINLLAEGSNYLVWIGKTCSDMDFLIVKMRTKGEVKCITAGSQIALTGHSPQSFEHEQSAAHEVGSTYIDDDSNLKNPMNFLFITNAHMTIEPKKLEAVLRPTSIIINKHNFIQFYTNHFQYVKNEWSEE